MYYRLLMVKLQSSFVGGWLEVGRLMFEPRSDTNTLNYCDFLGSAK